MAGKIAETREFIESCYVELQKVTWPDFDQTRSATFVIIVFVIIVSAVIWSMDAASRTAINFIMSIFGA